MCTPGGWFLRFLWSSIEKIKLTLQEMTLISLVSQMPTFPPFVFLHIYLLIQRLGIQCFGILLEEMD